jgi:putative ABC transport system ATP-binding protein
MADQRRILAIGIAGGVLWQAAGILLPVLLGWIIDSGIRAENSRVVWWGATAIVAIAVVEAIGIAIRHRSACTADERGRVAMRDALVAAVVADERGPTAELSPGELLGRATGDVDELGGFLDTVSHTVAYAVSVPAVVVILAFVDWPLAIVIAVMIPALVAVMWRYSAVWQERSTEVREAFDATTGAGEELIEGFRVTAGLGIGREMADRYTDRSAVLRDTSIRRGRLWLAFEPFVEGLSMIAVTVVMWLGGLRVIDGHLEVGGLVTAVGLALFLTWPVRTLGERIVTIQTALASAARLIDVLGHPIEAPDDDVAAPAAVSGPLAVSLRAITVERAGSVVLQVPDLALPARAMVRISGPTGAGKSTLLQVIAGELDATQGSVHLGGVAVGGWAPTARRGAGAIPVRRDHRRQRSLRRPRCIRRRGPGRAGGGRCTGVRRHASRRDRDGARRAWHHVVGWAAATDRAGAGARRRTSGPRARRRHLGRRPRPRAQHPRRHPAPANRWPDPRRLHQSRHRRPDGRPHRRRDRRARRGGSFVRPR